MISGLLETRLPNENLQKDLSGHTVPKPKPAQRIKGVSTGSGRDPKILITTVLISAYIWFSISHISIIFEETDVTACRCQPAPPLHVVQKAILASSAVLALKWLRFLQLKVDIFSWALRCFLLHTFQCLFSVLQIWKLGYRADSA